MDGLWLLVGSEASDKFICFWSKQLLSVLNRDKNVRSTLHPFPEATYLRGNYVSNISTNMLKHELLDLLSKRRQYKYLPIIFNQLFLKKNKRKELGNRKFQSSPPFIIFGGVALGQFS